MAISGYKILIFLFYHKTSLISTESPYKIIIGLCLDMEFWVMIYECYRIHYYRRDFNPYSHIDGCIFCLDFAFMEDLIYPFCANSSRRNVGKQGAYFCAVL